jgi:hypothetical protein
MVKINRPQSTDAGFTPDDFRMDSPIESRNGLTLGLSPKPSFRAITSHSVIVSKEPFSDAQLQMIGSLFKVGELSVSPDGRTVALPREHPYLPPRGDVEIFRNNAAHIAGLNQPKERQNANNLFVEADLTNTPAGRNISQYVGLVQNGDFRVPKPLLDAAQQMANELISVAQQQGVDLSKSPQWRDAGLLTNDGRVNTESLSAYLLAKSMGANTHGVSSGLSQPVRQSLTATFDGKLTPADYKADPKLVFEMARQIMGDNGMRDVVGPATNTPQADANFVSGGVGRTESGLTAKC